MLHLGHSGAGLVVGGGGVVGRGVGHHPDRARCSDQVETSRGSAGDDGVLRPVGIDYRLHHGHLPAVVGLSPPSKDTW